MASSVSRRDPSCGRSLRILAAAMSSKDCAITIGGFEAATRWLDGGKRCEIQIPDLSDKYARDQDFAIQVRGYLDHEIGHVKFSSFPLWRDFVQQGDYQLKLLGNIFDDIRVESLMSSVFPGAKLNLKLLADSIFQGREYDSVADCRELDAMLIQFCLLRVRGYASPARVACFRALLQANFVGGANIADTWIKAVDKESASFPMSDMAACLAAARRLYDLLVKLCAPNTDPEQDQSGDGSQVPSGSSGDGSQVPSGSSGDEQGQDQSGDGDDSGDEQGQDQSGDEQGQDQSGDGDDSGDEQGQDQSGDEQGQDQSGDGVNQDILKRLGRMSVNVDIGSIMAGRFQACRNQAFIYTESLDHASADAYAKLRQLPSESDKLAGQVASFCRSRLGGLMQAKTLRRIYPSTRGKLNFKALYRLSTSVNPKIFQVSDEVVSVNTHCEILLDLSGSMDGSQTTGFGVVIGMARGLSSFPGVKVGLSMFCDNVFYRLASPGGVIPSKCFIRPGGSTPLAASLDTVLASFDYSDSLKRRLCVLISDGDPDRGKLFETSVQTARDLNVQLCGIELTRNSKLSKYIGTDYIVKAQDISNLQSALYQVFKRFLLAQAL